MIHDWLQYAERVQGYTVRPRDGGQGIVVLDHAGLRDRVALAEGKDGRCIYASVPDYAPREKGESAERALARLRECITRSPSKGSVEQFVERAERLRDFAEGPERPRREPTVGVAAALRAPAKDPLSQRVYGLGPVPQVSVAAAPPTPEQVAARQRTFDEANRAIDARLTASQAPAVGPRSREALAPAPAERAPGARVNLGQCRYDWSPSVRVPGGRGGGPDRGR